jgi:hypothetical protein
MLRAAESERDAARAEVKRLGRALTRIGETQNLRGFVAMVLSGKDTPGPASPPEGAPQKGGEPRGTWDFGCWCGANLTRGNK